MKNKKKILIVLVTFIFIGTISIGSLASWFTSNDSVTNKFNIGNYDVVTHEEFTPEGHNIGENITKEVNVQNTGTLPAYVRVKIVPFWKNGMPLKYNGIETVTLNFTGSTEWFKVGDFYYYKKVLQPGEITDMLLEGLSVNSELANNSEYSINDLVVDVFTESVIYEGDMQGKSDTPVDENNNGEIESGEERYNYSHNDKYDSNNTSHVEEYFGLGKNNMDKIRELPEQSESQKENN